MIYVFMLIDKPEGEALRLEIRPQHRAYLAEMADRMAFAGPLCKEDGKSMIGSLIGIDFESREAAHAWLQNEPFTKAGLYASTTIQAFVNMWPQKAGFPAPH
jgi:uncharacterized protein